MSTEAATKTMDNDGEVGKRLVARKARVLEPSWVQKTHPQPRGMAQLVEVKHATEKLEPDACAWLLQVWWPLGS